MLGAFVYVKIREDVPVSVLEIAQSIAKIKDVSEVMLTSGEWPIIVKINYETMTDLSNFVVSELSKIRGVGKTDTVVILDQIK
ncbi:Lrp/AsnC ligand binding domain-containing protein [Candidatus Parvarchaeota archaeon]|jgi:Lrp/AsnC family transcriptional regulator for asnA, asnC and gidA|uniref:Lrp/AsnC ligand binding domain-containing protein n=1 Tax=Candidatus Acidifodinimicrobium mancum TaxID=2898728 RepID=A0A8T3UUF7_9ARCH|nr:Lrp/AsnC ligand binding domain-containing protein [Candidatus Acidifodinimicrobium mancum]MBE5728563.1 Lrp/AsnC ligand binding domain-containing protein [Candidatus Acidifodinimicrobium mancum]MBE5728715.1 Lrp/AsnC ligand binding domain-containing protein [Candidatus Acidifodinimicrobium mancum]MBE5729686.1 Lrp/AsnC ligand binding domain-containing protein [Candidatus Acidifodinimicrobium mancum]MBE5730277.1 Lrp/AsnC ligand binding domain-containing protein [Candidatus Acidifodinimicrobium m